MNMRAEQMAIKITIIDEVFATHTPARQEFKHWANSALQASTIANHVDIRLVDKMTSAALNAQYRNKKGPTNVLAFNYSDMPGIPSTMLGDLVLCSDLVFEEAIAQQISVEAHWAHLIIHGMLHLQGYDHETCEQAKEMEELETNIVLHLGYADPYAIL